MAKYAGWVGYVTQEETKPGVWTSVVTEQRMRGDVLRLSNVYEAGDKINDDLHLEHRISLVGDKFSYNNFMDLRYVEYLGVKWKVTSVEVQRPRLIVTLGGVYNPT